MSKQHKPTVQLAYSEPLRNVADGDQHVHTFTLFIDRRLRAVFAIDEKDKTIAIGQPNNSKDAVAAFCMLISKADHHIGQLLGTRWRVTTRGGTTICMASAENLNDRYVMTRSKIDTAARNAYEANVFHMQSYYDLPDNITEAATPVQQHLPLPHESASGEARDEALKDERCAHHSDIVPPTTPELARAIVDEVMHRMAGSQPS